MIGGRYLLEFEFVPSTGSSLSQSLESLTYSEVDSLWETPWGAWGYTKIGATRFLKSTGLLEPILAGDVDWEELGIPLSNSQENWEQFLRWHVERSLSEQLWSVVGG